MEFRLYEPLCNPATSQGLFLSFCHGIHQDTLTKDILLIWKVFPCFQHVSRHYGLLFFISGISSCSTAISYRFLLLAASKASINLCVVKVFLKSGPLLYKCFYLTGYSGESGNFAFWIYIDHNQNVASSRTYGSPHFLWMIMSCCTTAYTQQSTCNWFSYNKIVF